MSTKDKGQKNDARPGKKRKAKRKANSSLNSSGHSEHNSPPGQRQRQGSGGVSEKSKHLEGISECQQNQTIPHYSSSPYTYQPSNMSFSQQMQQIPFPVQGAGQSQPQPSAMSYMNAPMSPNQIPGSQQVYNVPPPPSNPPSWMADLIKDVKEIKLSMAKLDKIEQTVNMISLKVSDLETKVNSMDIKVNDVEDSCKFISSENDDRKKELEKTKTELKSLKSNCKTLEDKNSKLETKVVDLESRSMRENLLFYGIPEGGPQENCEILIKELCVNHLEMPEAQSMLIDRAHRIGPSKPNKTRPIVVKFHYFGEREAVRTRSYDKTESLKQAKVGVGVQWPQQVRETRKSLYPVMQKEKQKGKNVKMVRDKLYINGTEYKPTEQDQNA